mmetsp:Transcript_82655/g.267542  ORF Transcript_82655/g.267542 Transcript_82655/m.267542 type:complete len:225 (-) Transcript_82655:351-1025(-)
MTGRTGRWTTGQAPQKLPLQGAKRTFACGVSGLHPRFTSFSRPAGRRSSTPRSHALRAPRRRCATPLATPTGDLTRRRSTTTRSGRGSRSGTAAAAAVRPLLPWGEPSCSSILPARTTWGPHLPPLRPPPPPTLHPRRRRAALTTTTQLPRLWLRSSSSSGSSSRRASTSTRACSPSRSASAAFRELPVPPAGPLSGTPSSPASWRRPSPRPREASAPAAKPRP